MTGTEKIEALSEVLDCETEVLHPETELEEIEEWDSIAKLSLMAFVKKKFGKVLQVNDFTKFRTVQDVLNEFE